MFSRNSFRKVTAWFQPINDKGLIKLNTNENPYPPSPLVTRSVLEETKRLQLYPEPFSLKLRRLIAEKQNLKENQVIIGNGSDDILNLCVRAFSDTGRSVGITRLLPVPTLTSLQRSSLHFIEFTDDQFDLPTEKILSSEVNLFFLTNPHAPSGVAFDQSKIVELAKCINAILVVDEAYADFANDSAIRLLSDVDNLIVTRTFSKSYSLAGSE